MFVDTRLHIAVRPVLEYAIPQAGRGLLAVVLGDRPRAEVADLLEACCIAPTSAEPPVVEEHHPELERLCARVCTNAHEYLRGVSAEWAAHIHKHADAARLKTGRVSREYDHAVQVRERYRARNPTLVEREYRAEIARLEETLRLELDRLRDAAPPVCERPGDLVAATNELKNGFSDAYGRVPTRILTQLKARFEYELTELQRGIASEFTRSVSGIFV